MLRAHKVAEAAGKTVTGIEVDQSGTFRLLYGAVVSDDDRELAEFRAKRGYQ